MEHGKDHGAHHAATQHSKKGHEQTDSKHQQHQTDESQAPRTGFQVSWIQYLAIVECFQC